MLYGVIHYIKIIYYIIHNNDQIIQPLATYIVRLGLSHLLIMKKCWKSYGIILNVYENKLNVYQKNSLFWLPLTPVHPLLGNNKNIYQQLAEAAIYPKSREGLFCCLSSVADSLACLVLINTNVLNWECTQLPRPHT